MDVNNIRGEIGYLNNSMMTDSKSKNVNLKNNNCEKSQEFKDSLDISKAARDIPTSRRVGFGIDKGTAANTTVFVNRGTFNQIMNYTTYNPDCQWSEMGVDEEKRWVVVNGQRFECPLSKEEKEVIRRLREEGTLIGVLAKEDKKKEKCKNKSEEHKSVNLSFDKDNKIKVDGMENLGQNSKLTNLMNNDKVMKMLSDIMGINGGQGISLGL